MKTIKKIKNILLKTVLFAVVMLNAQSCVDLEEDTSSIFTMENLADEGAIVAALAPIYREYLNTVEKPQFHFPTAYGADDITTWDEGNKAPLRVFDKFDYGNGENSDILWLEKAWNHYWKIIYFSNTLIDGLKTSTAPEEIVRIAEGEARFFRALAYFDLVKRWGNMPVILDGMIPTGDEQRATVLDNYLHIEADLTIAEENLPNPGETANVGRVSKAAAKALFAEFYLTLAGWPVKDSEKYSLAAQKAKDVIDMNYFELLPISELWLLKNQNSRESVFSVQFSVVEDLRNGYITAYNHHESLGYSDVLPERQFYLDFPEGPRKEWTFYKDIPRRKYDSKNGVIISKDPPTVPWEESDRKHPMFKKYLADEDLTISKKPVSYRAVEIYRYAEVLLMYAEASARANGGTATGDALEAYNQVKRRAAGLDYLTTDVSADATSATADDILQEKGWEIAGELGKRWWDLVRTETVVQAMERRDPTEEVALLIAPNSIDWHQYIAPIPYEALTTSKLEQNPGGFKIK